MKKLVIIALLFCVKHVDAQVCFSPAANFPVVNGASSVTSADFNGDSKADLAVTNNGSDNISILLGDGAGNFGFPGNFSVGTNPYGICNADFNGDGFKDLAVSNHGSNNVSILLGNGSGGFGSATGFSVGTGPVSIVSADFNGDGKADVATANFSSNNVSVILGDGAGNFGAPINSNTGTGPHSIVTADFDLDGKADLAVANYTSNNVSILYGLGTGNFWGAANTSAVSNSSPYAILAVDLNADNRKDLVVSNSGSINTLSVFLSTSAGSFTIAPISLSLASTAGPTGVASGDFDGDGKMDLAVANETSDDINVLLSIGTGTVTSFASKAVFNLTSGAGPNALINADFNGDGKSDLATANWGTSDASVLLNAPLPTITVAQSTTIMCGGKNDTLKATGGISYVWTPTTSISCNTCAAPVATPTVTKTYTVTGTDANGCTNKTSVVVNVNPLPVITITATPNPVCKGTSCVITAGGANTYTCLNAGVFVGAPFVPSVTATYTVTGTSAAGCIGKSTKTITVTPVVKTTASSDTLCLGGTATIVASGASTYTWSGNATGNTATVTVSPTTTSTYVVSGTDASGCINTISAVITVLDTTTITVFPKVIVTPKTDTLCYGGSTYIVAKGALTFTWTLGATGNNDTVFVGPMPAFGSAHTYTYTVIGTDARNCKNSKTTHITVLDTTVSKFYAKIKATPHYDTLCLGGSTFIAASGGTTYTWTNNASITNYTANINNDTVFVAPVATDTYVVTGTDYRSCRNTISRKITVVSATAHLNEPKIVALPQYDTLCAGGGVNTIIAASGAVTYTWTSNASGNNDTVFVSPTSTTNYVVSGTDGRNCTNSDTATIVVLSGTHALMPKVVATAGFDTLCSGGSTMVVATGAVTYTWSGGASSNNDTISVTPVSTSTYIVSGSDIRNCVNSDTAVITVVASGTTQYPMISISNVHNICNGSSANLVASGAGPNGTYTWISGTSGNTPTVTVSPIVTTTYVVNGTDARNCTNTATTQIIVFDTSTSYCHIGIRQINNLSSVKIYPNPNNGYFVVEPINSNKMVVRVFDLSGKMVLIQGITETTTIDAGKLNEGIYIVNLSSNEGVINKRLIIVR